MPTSWKGPGLCNVELRRDIAGCAGQEEQKKKVTYEHFPSCSTHSNMLGPILMPLFNQLWSLPWKFKRELFGKKALQNNGGQEGDDNIEELDPKPKRTPESVEPVFYHGYPTTVYQDTLKAHQVRYCIDLTPGDGAAALACYKLGIFYLGLILNNLLSSSGSPVASDCSPSPCTRPWLTREARCMLVKMTL